MLDRITRLLEGLGWPLGAGALEGIEGALAAKEVRLALVPRPANVADMHEVTAGLFGFWKRTARERESAIAALDAIGSRAQELESCRDAVPCRESVVAWSRVVPA